MKQLRKVAAPLAVLVLALLCFSTYAYADTETEGSYTSTSTFGGTHLRFLMVPSPSAGYSGANGSASIELQEGVLAVHFQAEGIAGGAHLILALIANGTSHPVANMSANYDGEVEAEGTVTLAQGYYAVGVQVLETPTSGSPILVLSSSPATEILSVGQAYHLSTTTREDYTQSVSTVQGGETEDDRIMTAIQTKIIPAVVDVGNGSSTIHVNDGNFSVSVGRYQPDGYLVSIFATNVTGPRVLLVNVTSNARDLFAGPVQITLDGSAVQQGGSISQVLSSQAGDPARFVLVSNPSALSLLISIPHFSYHTFGIVPFIVQAGSSLRVNHPVLMAGALAVTTAVLLFYARRTKLAI